MGLITGKCMWAKVMPHQLDKKYAKEKTGGIWSIDIVVDEQNRKVLKEEGLEHLIVKKDDGTETIKFKRNELQKATGKPNSPPKVVDAKKKEIVAGKDNLYGDFEIGNGSEVVISFTTYTGFKSKKYATLQTVQVIKLNKFERKVANSGIDYNIKEVDGGFSIEDGAEGDDDTPPWEDAKEAAKV
jgi:hypothetical protein